MKEGGRYVEVSGGKEIGSGVSFLGLLTLLFIGLKLTDYVDWSWWWVTAPLWGPLAAPLALVLGLIVLIFLFAVTALPIFLAWEAVDRYMTRRHRRRHWN